MNKFVLYTVVILLVIFSGTIVLAVGETVITEHDLKEKILANRILDMYLTDAGIKGFELNQYGAPSNEYIVPGPYDKLPAEISNLAESHNVRILPSQQSPKMTPLKFLAALLYRSFFILVPVLILVWIIRVNKKLAAIIELLKK
jgi:hypothetical protein